MGPSCCGPPPNQPEIYIEEVVLKLTFVAGLGGRRLPGGPVGPDLPPPQPLASHLLYGVLRVLNTRTQWCKIQPASNTPWSGMDKPWP